MSESRGLSLNEIEPAINHINEKYHINLLRYTYDINDRHFDMLCDDIKDLEVDKNLTAVLTMSSHSFSIQIHKNKDGTTLIIDDSYALMTKNINGPSFSIIPLGIPATYLTNFEFVNLIEELIKKTNINSIYANKNQYQFENWSCHTFAIFNAKHLALQPKAQIANEDYETIFHKKLDREIKLYKRIGKHLKYDQYLEDIKASKIDEKTTKYKKC
jgi:hypothetical protein